MNHRNRVFALLLAVLLLTALLSACSFVPEEIQALESNADKPAESTEAADTADPSASAETAKRVEALPGAPLWPWILGEVVLLAGLAVFFILRHNKKQKQ